VALTSDLEHSSRLTRAAASNRGDRVFRSVMMLAAACVPLLLIAIFILLLLDAWPAVQRYGMGFLGSSEWDPVAEKFGAAAYIYGTVVTSILSVLIAGPIGVACAVYIAEYAPKWLAEPVSFLITLLAAIPSIIYGLWGFRILAPIMRAAVEPFLKNTLGNVPVVGALFSGATVGRDYLVAGVRSCGRCPTPSVKACWPWAPRGGRPSSARSFPTPGPALQGRSFLVWRAHSARQWP